MTLTSILKKGVHTAAQVTGYGVLYVAALCATSYYADFKYSDSPINSQEDLTRIVSEERKILNIPDSIKIISEYYNSDKVVPNARKLNHNNYKIQIGTLSLETRGTVKHELYHIADGHCDLGEQQLFKESKLAFGVIYLFYGEPQAIIYSAFNIKL